MSPLPIDSSNITIDQEEIWQTHHTNMKGRFFEITSKRRKGFPSETRVKKGLRIVHGSKELREKLGRNDRCPCGDRDAAFKKCCMQTGRYDGKEWNHFFPRVKFSFCGPKDMGYLL